MTTENVIFDTLKKNIPVREEKEAQPFFMKNAARRHREFSSAFSAQNLPPIRSFKYRSQRVHISFIILG